MIKFFRKIRQSLLAENRFKKYLLYALGEIILVVIGILIAIQINNANQKRLNNDTLNGYLNSIAHNIESDLKRAENINKQRLELFPRISAIRSQMSPDYYKIISEVYGKTITEDYRYSLENIDFMSQTINDAWDAKYLTPNISGFESLTNSGFLSQLQGTDLERLLFNYYNMLEELTIMENNYNASLHNSFDDFMSADLPGTYAFFTPGYRDWNIDLGEKFPSMVDEIITHPSLTTVLFWPYEIILKYENLLITGKALHQMILSGKKDFSEEINQQLEKVYDEYGEAPYPKVMRDGYITTDYSLGVASANNSQGVNQQFIDKHFTMQFYPTAWSVVYLYVGNGVIAPDRVKDFSNFKTLQLKLRGVKGGEKIAISLKDKSNPTDGSETKVPLTLTSEWQYYEIPLSSFAPIQLEEILMATSIIVENQACAIELESIEFLR